MGELIFGWDLFFGFVVSVRALVEFLQKLDEEEAGGLPQLVESRCDSLQDRAMLVLLQNKGAGNVSLNRKRGSNMSRVMTEHEKAVFDGAVSSFVERIAVKDGNGAQGASKEPGAASLGKEREEEEEQEEDDDDGDGEFDYYDDENEFAIGRTTKLMNEACALFKLPVIRVGDFYGRRGYGSEGILVHVADKSRHKKDSEYLGESQTYSALRIDPDFFVVSDAEKLALAFIAGLFQLVPLPPLSIQDVEDRRGWFPDGQGPTLKPAWIQCAWASLG
jgi:hypothetical protein